MLMSSLFLYNYNMGNKKVKVKIVKNTKTLEKNIKTVYNYEVK